MRVAKTVTSVCEHCGNEYQKARTTAKYCSDTCRVKAHRKAKEAKIEPLFDVAANAIYELGKHTEGEFSFEAIMFLKTIEKMASYQDISSKSSWWRCSKCWQAVQKELPKDGDCSCGKTQNASWRLQKTII